MNGFKQISTTTVWKLKKQWDIDDEKEMTDVKKLHYGLFNSDQTIVAFTCISIKNNEAFFTIYENKPYIHTSEVIQYLIKKATLLNMSRLSCAFNEENKLVYEQYGFDKFYSSKYAKQLFSLYLKK
ncbi:hypothetical protein UJ101_02448 [Flavobacteriaceae bacterium UJ101]|nr:hypothetical protein UJ101_02448 [Flavobacteriaceae bacterium UJ101]